MQCMNPRGFFLIITMATVEVTTGTSEMETSTSASAKVKIVAPCNSDSGASSSRLNEGHQVQLRL